MLKARAGMARRPQAVGGFTLWTRTGENISSPDGVTGRDGTVDHYGHHPATGPACEPSRVPVPADYIRISVTVRRRSGAGPVSLRLLVRTSDAESSDELIDAIYTLTPDLPENLVEIRGFTSQNPFEVELIPQAADEIVADVGVLVGCCCHEPSITPGTAVTTVTFAATTTTLAPGLTDALLTQILNRLADETQKTQLVGTLYSGGAGTVESAQLAYTGGNNGMATANAVAVANPLQNGNFGYESIAGAGSIAVPAGARLQRISLIAAPGGTIAFTGVAVGGFAAMPAPVGVLHEIDVLGRCSATGVVTGVGTTWLAASWTLDP